MMMKCEVIFLIRSFDKILICLDETQSSSCCIVRLIDKEGN